MEFENVKDMLLAEIDTGLKYAHSLDPKAEFEIYLFHRGKKNVEIKQGVVEATDGIIAGNAIRVVKNKYVSFSSSSGVSASRIKNNLREAVSSLKAISEKDDRFKGFCEPKPSGNEGIFANEILEQTTDDLVKMAKQLLADTSAVNGRILAAADCNVSWGGFAIGNTLGLQKASSSASNSCSAYAVAIAGEERRTASEELITREKAINIEGIGEKAARKATSLLGAKKLDKTTTMPTIWVPWAAASYILSSITYSANGQFVVEGLSPIADKIGKKIASSRFSLLDDGQDPAGIQTESIDAEGHPQRQTKIIENGVLKQFLFDSYYGRISGTESTGNCSRGGGPFGASLPYEVAPAISSTNLVISAGNKTEEELISSIDEQAILIADIPIGIFHSDVATGEFSAVASSAFLIENGEKKMPVQPISVSGNYYKGFEQLLSIGSNVEITSLGVTTPSLVFDEFSIVG